MGFLWLYLVYNMDVMEAWQILLIIIAIVLFVYVAGLFVILTRAFDFGARLKRRLNSLNMILFERRAILLRLYETCLKHGSQFDDKALEMIETMKAYNFSKPRFEVCKSAISLQKSIQNRIYYEFQVYPEIKDETVVESSISMLDDLERNIRTSCSLFNADVLGYNYWIAVPGYHWIFFILGRKAFDSIN